MKFEPFLHPELYADDPRAARFVEALTQHEIQEQAEVACEKLCRLLPPTDDIAGQLEILEEESKKRINKTGTFNPFFTIFNEGKSTCLMADTPKTALHLQSLVAAGKCLALSLAAHSVFFSTVVYHKNGEVIDSRRAVDNDAEVGILITGNSLHGLSFQSVNRINFVADDAITFEEMSKNIGKADNCDRTFHCLMDIKDTDEMSEILRQLPQMFKKTNLSEKDILVNFYTMFLALSRCH